MSTVHVALTVNGERHELDVEPRLLLVHLLRDRLGLTGTHVGCDTSNCGACTVHLDGEAVKSCTVLAVQADGAEIKTIEGMLCRCTGYHNIVRAVQDAAKAGAGGALQTPTPDQEGAENVQAVAETGLGA